MDGGLSFDKFKLPRIYVGMLVGLITHGKGFGKLDAHGRVMAGPTKQLLEGDAVAWLWLCAYGCIIGREDRLGEIEITPLGQTFVDEHHARLRGAT